MDPRKLQQLSKIRKALKQKYKSLKSDIIHSQTQLEKTYKPITEPLQKLLENIKTEIPIKKEQEIVKQETGNKPLVSASSTPKKKQRKEDPRHEESARQPLNIFNQYLPSHGYTFLEDTFSSGFAPLDEDETIDEEVESSRQYLHDLSQAAGYNDYLLDFDELPRYYIDASIKDTNDEFDHQHGIVHDMETEKFKIGDSELAIEGKDVKVHNITYPGTVGLYELLFKKKPASYKVSDLDNYMDILQRTNAYRKNYNPNEQIQGTNSYKYITIIKPYLVKKRILKEETIHSTSNRFEKPRPPRTRSQSFTTKVLRPRKGTGMMNLSRNPIDYVYFDDINELIERLKLLIASQIAGNTGHNNEIISIVEELREAKIIK